MAMKELVSGECGGLNPLMQLASKLQESNIQQKEIFGKEPQDQFLSDRDHHAAVVPQTFNMQSLFDEMQDMQRPHEMSRTSNHHDDILADWNNEYRLKEHQNIATQEIGTITSNQNHLAAYPPPAFLSYPPPLTMQMLRYRQPHYEQDNSIKWAHEYLDESFDRTENLKTYEMQKTAYEILESTENQEINATEFIKYVNKMKNGDIKENEAKEWMQEYKLMNNKEVSEDQEDQKIHTQEDFDYWEKLQQDWNDLFSQEQFHNEEEYALGGFSATQKQEYDFEESNPFVNHDSAFEEGLKMLKKGDLISAILLFEEAVRVKPEHAEAWQYLGTSQAENEQEMLAIAALNKCVELQPDNLTARMSLAVSYTNESLQSQACDALREWIIHNPRYSHLLSGASSPKHATPYTPSIISSAMFKEIQDLYLAAARISPHGDIDADIQVGLGVLFNISGDYDKAIDCFNAGLQARNDSADIWNKLGATLANGGKSADAIEAYRNALEIRPGFIRCRYNLGISCINMKAYNEAAEHFLSALNMQRQGEDPSRTASTMSENIWSTLRMTLSLLGRLDLMRATDKKDLRVLNKEFKIREG